MLHPEQDPPVYYSIVILTILYYLRVADLMADNCVSIAEEACDNVAFINLDEETGKSMMERGAV